MKLSFCGILILGSLITASAKPLFSSQDLYHWLNKLYAFEDQADLQHPLLDNLPPLEQDFAAVNFYWWQTLKGYDTEQNVEAIQSLGRKYFHDQKEPEKCSAQELYMAVLLASYEARIHMIRSETFSSAQVYLSAIPYLKRMLKLRHLYDEYALASQIYDACINEASNNWTYLALVLLLPDAQNENAFSDLKSWNNSQNPFCKTEAHYFSYKVAVRLREDKDEALRQLELLVNMYPENLVYRLEKLRLQKEMKLPSASEESELLQRLKNGQYPQTVKAHFLTLVKNA